MKGREGMRKDGVNGRSMNRGRGKLRKIEERNGLRRGKGKGREGVRECGRLVRKVRRWRGQVI